MENTLPSPTPFLTHIFQKLNVHQIDVSKYELDHICYRVESFEKYISLKSKLEKKGELLSDKKINGRPISVFKLYQPIIFEKRKIYLLELPAPKRGSQYAEGWEHVEFVVPDLDLFLEKYVHVNFDKKGFSKNGNRDVRVKYEKTSVKFHEHDLEYVIRHLD